MKLSSFLRTERNEITTTGKLTRVDYLRINKKINLTIEISGYLEFHWFSYQNDSL